MCSPNAAPLHLGQDALPDIAGGATADTHPTRSCSPFLTLLPMSPRSCQAQSTHSRSQSLVSYPSPLTRKGAVGLFTAMPDIPRAQWSSPYSLIYINEIITTIHSLQARSWPSGQLILPLWQVPPLLHLTDVKMEAPLSLRP